MVHRYGFVHYLTIQQGLGSRMAIFQRLLHLNEFGFINILKFRLVNSIEKNLLDVERTLYHEMYLHLKEILATKRAALREISVSVVEVRHCYEVKI
jgi:hypothetical protein